MKKQLKNKELIISYLKIEENNQKELLSEIEGTEKGYLLKIQNDFQMIRQVSENLSKQRKDSLMNLLKDNTKQQNLLEYLENFSKNKLQLTILQNPKVDYQLQEIDYANHTNNEQSLTLKPFTNNTKDTGDPSYIITFLRKRTNMEKIDLSYNILKKGDWSIVCQQLEQSSYPLKEVNFSNCDLTEKLCKPIEKLLHKCCHIELFDISNNNRLGNGIQRICNGLEKASDTLRDLNFSNCGLKWKNWEFFEIQTIKFGNLEVINLKKNKNIANGLFSFLNGFSSSATTLKEINLSNCNIAKTACPSLETFLGSCSNLEIIDLSYNTGMGKGLSAVIKSLEKSSKTLKKILISNCNLTEKNWKKIKTILMKFDKLETIDLSFNDKIENDLHICSGLSNSVSVIYEMFDVL
ncbi:unnamed protein product [Dimorphilus gyrociliatus]|uniref:Uncharacterized protein n=1 Tax=Dimorphilus gyrociliatus TaxID=2664684 RepID=A0A7I8WEB0_9ANNE|nr:unnamed protein product [Dimorphilus gyrociliatus]